MRRALICAGGGALFAGAIVGFLWLTAIAPALVAGVILLLILFSIGATITNNLLGGGK